MAFFSSIPSADFTPLFRLLDDYDSHRATKRSGSSSLRSFQPRFDVREVKDAYELHGELPGIDQKDISIEFTDPTTLVIKGRTEREFSSGSPAAGALEGDAQPQGRITGEAHNEEAETNNGYRKPSVEEEDGSPTPAESSTDVSTTQPSSAPATAKHQAQRYKYWVSERSVGEFHRSFSFPTRVDQDAVKASLKNGILSIVVPKAPEPTSRRIFIE